MSSKFKNWFENFSRFETDLEMMQRQNEPSEFKITRSNKLLSSKINSCQNVTFVSVTPCHLSSFRVDSTSNRIIVQVFYQ